MEKETITTEIKRETTLILLWITVGVVAVTVAFFLPERTSELWPSLNLAGVVAGIYIAALLTYVLRKPIPRRTRWLIAIFMAVIGGALVFSWIGMYNQSYWQQQTILDISTRLRRHMMTFRAPNYLFATLEQYHQQGTSKRESLGRVFQRLYPAANVGDNIYKPEYVYKPEWKNDHLQLFLHWVTDSTITVIACDSIAHGHDPSFKNIDGHIGRVQERFKLTEKGLSHDVQN